MPSTARAAISPAATPSTAVGCARRRRSTSASRSSDSTLQAARRPETSIPHANTARSANAAAAGRTPARARERGAVERLGDDQRQHAGLHQHRQRGRDSEQPVDRQQRPRGRCSVQQARVQRASRLALGGP